MNRQPSANQKNTAKIGLFSSVTLLISAVVGIGIFFKNRSIVSNNDGSGWGVLISWVVAALITLTTALAFAEIISADKKHDGSGLAGWARKICGHRVGRFVLIALPMFYFIFKLVDTSFFAGESVFLIFNNQIEQQSGTTIGQNTWMIVLVAFAIMTIFIGVNAFSTRAAKTISWVAAVAKFLPLIIICILGIIVGVQEGFNHSLFNNGTANPIHPLQPHGDISALGIFASLPALLFTFDSFLMIGNAANSMNQPQKTIPRALLIGIPTIAGIYLLVTIGQLFVGQPDVYSFFSYVVRHFGGGNDAVTAINVVIGCTIMVSLFGSVNAMTLSAVHSIQSAIDDEIIVGSKLFKKLTNGRRLYAGALFGYIIGTFITCLIAIPIIVMNSDAAYDGVSNLPTLFFFIIYGTVILFGLINHYTGKVEVHRMKMFPIIAVISILGCYFAFCYNLFYEFTARNFVNDAPVNWGMFKHATIDRWIASIIVWIIFILFLALPFINDLCIKLFRKNNNQRLIWM